MVIAGTGYRPSKLGGFNKGTYKRLLDLAENAFIRSNPSLVISGMALGWDMAIAQAAINLNIPFDAYIPFKGQESVWPKESQDYYNWLLSKARQIKVCSEGGYANWKMQKRNEMMVDDCDVLLCLWDGSSGGTENCIIYANRRLPKERIINLWYSYTISRNLHQNYGNK